MSDYNMFPKIPDWVFAVIAALAAIGGGMVVGKAILFVAHHISIH
jgi:hypothetical protein